MSRCTCRYPWADVISCAGQFVHGDMEKMPLDSSLFDVVISNGAFCLAPDKEAAFREVYRVLKPGGRSSILHPSSILPSSVLPFLPQSSLLLHTPSHRQLVSVGLAPPWPPDWLPSPIFPPVIGTTVCQIRRKTRTGQVFYDARNLF